MTTSPLVLSFLFILTSFTVESVDPDPCSAWKSNIPRGHNCTLLGDCDGMSCSFSILQTLVWYNLSVVPCVKPTAVTISLIANSPANLRWKQNVSHNDMIPLPGHLVDSRFGSVETKLQVTLDENRADIVLLTIVLRGEYTLANIRQTLFDQEVVNNMTLPVPDCSQPETTTASTTTTTTDTTPTTTTTTTTTRPSEPAVTSPDVRTCRSARPADCGENEICESAQSHGETGVCVCKPEYNCTSRAAPASSQDGDPSASKEASSSPLSVQVTIGIASGGVALVLVLFGVVYFILRRRKVHHSTLDDNEVLMYSPVNQDDM